MAKRDASTKVAATFADADWIDAVASKAGVGPDIVAEVHRVHGIEASGTLPRTRKLVLRSVEFGGVKNLSQLTLLTGLEGIPFLEDDDDQEQGGQEACGDG